MALGDIQINSTLLPTYGLRYTPGSTKLETKERTINGTLTSDIAWEKFNATITWEYPVSGTFLAEIVTIYLLHTDVTLTITNADLSTTVYTCSLDISKAHLREIASGNYAFSGFSVMLEEV